MKLKACKCLSGVYVRYLQLLSPVRHDSDKQTLAWVRVVLIRAHCPRVPKVVGHCTGITPQRPGHFQQPQYDQQGWSCCTPPCIGAPVVAKLDRLTRNVHFISSLMESKVDFVCCDFPEASTLTLHIMSAVAEHEARAISARTKAALAQAKLRGVKLDNPNLTAEGRHIGNSRGVQSLKDKPCLMPGECILQSQHYRTPV